MDKIKLLLIVAAATIILAGFLHSETAHQQYEFTAVNTASVMKPNLLKIKQQYPPTEEQVKEMAASVMHPASRWEMNMVRVDESSNQQASYSGSHGGPTACRAVLLNTNSILKRETTADQLLVCNL